MRCFALVVLLVSSVTVLVSPPASAQFGSPACQVVLEADPPTPLEMNEGDSLMLIITARYDGDKKAVVRLSAAALPSFVTGRVDNYRNCAECAVSDTLYIHPGFCDAGEHKLILLAYVDYHNGLEDKIEYHIKVNDMDQACLIQVRHSYQAQVDEQLAFPIYVKDADKPCKDTPNPRWSYHGYPFRNGAELLPGDYERMFVWTPDEQDKGPHWAYFTVNIGASECSDSVKIEVCPPLPDCVDGPPITLAEPQFTPGTSNDICYIPNCSAFQHQVCYFDSMAPGDILGCRHELLAAAEGEIQANCITIPNLTDGHTYGYFAAAYFTDDPNKPVPSDTIRYSTQDASPPYPVNSTTVRAEAGGVVVVNWYGVIDTVSYVTKYEIYRRLDAEDYQFDRVVRPEPGNDEWTYYTFVDRLGSGSGLREGEPYHYKVVAVDVVGNKGDGIETEAV
jgi:hypothetical protein